MSRDDLPSTTPARRCANGATFPVLRWTQLVLLAVLTVCLIVEPLSVACPPHASVVGTPQRSGLDVSEYLAVERSARLRAAAASQRAAPASAVSALLKDAVLPGRLGRRRGPPVRTYDVRTIRLDDHRALLQIEGREVTLREPGDGARCRVDDVGLR